MEKNYTKFIDFTSHPIGGMVVVDHIEEFDMVNVTYMSYITKVKLAFNVREDIVKIGFEDNSFELIAMDNCTEITINGKKVNSEKTFHEFALMVKNGDFDNIMKKM